MQVPFMWYWVTDLWKDNQIYWKEEAKYVLLENYSGLDMY